MYTRFFGLRDNPFNANPDPRYLFMTRDMQEAFACLTYGIQSRKGFVLLTGEVGTGKTTLLNKLMHWLHQQRVATAFVFNSRLNTTQFLDFMMADFGVPCESPLKSQVLLRLNQWLLDRHRAGETAVLIVDEAQNLSPRVLEEIRLLTNLETSTEKLLQIVLSGQPELEGKIRQPQLRQLRQRISLRCRLQPLRMEEMQEYIAERLRVAGANGLPIFSPEAIEAVQYYSRGIPRLINLLCEHSLINAFVDQVRPVPGSTVAAVAEEFELHEVHPKATPSTALRETIKLEETLQEISALAERLEEPAQIPDAAKESKE